MPPKTNSVMLRIGIRFRSATQQCPSSWIRIEAKKIRAVIAPTPQ
jgi:hypothetical protein